jgi:hypothetical protein
LEGSYRLQNRWVYEGPYLILVAGAAVLALAPVLTRSGWPLNEGSTAPLLLVQIYAAHFRHLDFFPIWSSSDGIGMGFRTETTCSPTRPV